ncbi:unnamed protein product [Ectocarpus sp. 13 AM-2016]
MFSDVGLLASVSDGLVALAIGFLLCVIGLCRCCCCRDFLPLLLPLLPPTSDNRIWCFLRKYCVLTLSQHTVACLRGAFCGRFFMVHVYARPSPVRPAVFTSTLVCLFVCHTRECTQAPSTVLFFCLHSKSALTALCRLLQHPQLNA